MQASQFANQPATQPLTQPASQSASQPASQPTNEQSSFGWQRGLPGLYYVIPDFDIPCILLSYCSPYDMTGVVVMGSVPCREQAIEVRVAPVMLHTFCKCCQSCGKYNPRSLFATIYTRAHRFASVCGCVCRLLSARVEHNSDNRQNRCKRQRGWSM